MVLGDKPSMEDTNDRFLVGGRMVRKSVRDGPGFVLQQIPYSCGEDPPCVSMVPPDNAEYAVISVTGLVVKMASVSSFRHPFVTTRSTSQAPIVTNDILLFMVSAILDDLN
jgi:hypothetical protein